MKIAIATKNDWSEVSGHAGQPTPEPRVALEKILVGKALVDRRFDITPLCELRDMFSRH